MKQFIDKLIERLKTNSVFGKYGNDYMESVFLSDAIKIVNQLAEEFATDINVVSNGWIPVSSGKLPDDGVPVDVTVREDNDNGGYDLYVFESWYREGRWAIDKNRYNPTVIAWKPKDAPYQPKGE